MTWQSENSRALTFENFCRGLVGISFERCVKYHRHVGRWTFVNMVAHFVALVVVYGSDVLTTRPGRWGEGNLYGLLAGTHSQKSQIQKSQILKTLVS